MELVGDGGDQVAWELGGNHVVGFFVQLGMGQCACTVNADTQVALACFRADLHDVDMDVAQGIWLELLLRRFAVHLRQAVAAMPLQAAMGCASGQMRQRRLPRIQAVIER